MRPPAYLPPVVWTVMVFRQPSLSEVLPLVSIHDPAAAEMLELLDARLLIRC